MPGALCPLNKDVKNNYYLMNALGRSALHQQQHSFGFYGKQPA